MLMDYSNYLYTKETAKQIVGGILKIIYKIIKFIIATIMKICMFCIYVISSIGLCVFGIGFPAGIWFACVVVKEMINGTPFLETSKWGLFLLFFAVPVVFAIMKTLTKPKK